MATLILGPLRLSYRLAAAAPVRHGALSIVPVARVSELQWQVGRLMLRLRSDRPAHVELMMLTGARRIALLPGLREHMPTILAGALLLAVVVAARPWPFNQRRSEHGA